VAAPTPADAEGPVGVDPNAFGMLAYRRQEELHHRVKSGASSSAAAAGSRLSSSKFSAAAAATAGGSRPSVRIICDHAQIESPLIWRALEDGPDFKCEFVERPLPPPLFAILDASVCVAVISDKAVLQARQDAAGTDAVRSLCDNLLRAMTGFEVVWVVIDCQAVVAESGRMTTERLRGRSGRRTVSLGRLQKWLHQIKAASPHVDIRFRYLCKFALGSLVLILEEALAASMERYVEIRKRRRRAGGRSSRNTAAAAAAFAEGGVGRRRQEEDDNDNGGGHQTSASRVAWRSRSFLRETESDKERFLCTIPGVDSFAAQMMLDEWTFVDMLHWPDQSLDSIARALPTVSKIAISAVRAALT
jgi:hypothetical protein